MGKTVQVSGFPYLVTAEEAKTCIEKHTGAGSVSALEVKKCRTGQRSYAKVQFGNNRIADQIISLANNRKLYFGTSYLKAFEMDTRIVQDRSYIHEMETLTLYFGCQTSKERFYSIWRGGIVSIKFGYGLKKMHLFLSYLSTEYKLQLSYEHIWEIKLYRPHHRNVKFLVIQLFAAPRIYKKAEDSVYNFYAITPDEQWVRTTDFTRNCIGQSSSLCLEIPAGVTLPKFRDHFVYYSETDSQFSVESGYPFSHNLDLVPILRSPREVNLPFKVLFKICSLVQQGCLPGPALNTNFFRLVDPRSVNIGCIEYALEKMYYLKECCYDPVRWLTEQYEQYHKFKQPPKSAAISLDDGLVYVRRVLVTPTRVYFTGPEVNQSNRVLRHYPDDIDNFLRVSFVDEDWEKIHSMDLSPRASSPSGKTNIYDRILKVLRDGIVIGDKRFEFLAFSSSQLRESSVWMFASRVGLTAAGIRAWMGDFRKIKNVAKYAARLGQSFGSSRETLSVARHEIEMIPDITIQRQGTEYNFSDGIGKISADFARRVAIKCGLEDFAPSAYQIRYGGFKGVVAVDPCSSKKLSLRNSMLKYESDNIKLDVLAWSKYQPCYLNRQLVTLLSTLGVRDEVFETKQREAVAQLNAILTDPLKAYEALELMAPGENTNILKEMLTCEYKPDVEPFLSMMLQTFRASKLQDLRTRTRIFVPEARSMMGCLDETGLLNYGEVFVQYSGSGQRQLPVGPQLYEPENYNRIAQGKVVVAKNPCLHPGDVRVLRAVNVPALNHMVDCVVFPRKGERPHPNECSGSDLDGDIYFVCWDKELIPRSMEVPMDYTPAPSMDVYHDVTIEEVQKYFVDYILNDSLGIISNAHVAFADKELLMAKSQPCLKLAQLFSIAVDFPKTGVPAEIPSDLRVKEYPDFMEKPPEKVTYVSTRVIGKLFREVKDITPEVSSIKSFTREIAMRSYDPDLVVHGFEEFVVEAFYRKTEYDFKLGNLMDYYGIKTEAEVLSGGAIRASKFFDRRRDADAVSFAMKSLRKEARAWFKVGSEYDDQLAKASAWYFVTYHHTYWGLYNEGMNRPHFISFPWCVYDKLIQIKKAKRDKRNNIARALGGLRLG
nr:probable RNA-dependent RNA polymerase 1 [Ipomoea batatas]